MKAEPAAPVRLEVPANAHGTRLDRFLAEPLGSRARAQALIDSGRVRVDGRLRAKSHQVAPGEVVEAWPQDDADEVVAQAGDAPFSIAYEFL